MDTPSPADPEARAHIDAFRALHARLADVYAGAAARSGCYAELVSLFEGCEAYLREYFQEVTKPQMTRVVERLQAGKDPSDEELEILRQWIIGDTVNYVRGEQQYADWLAELRRIMAALEAEVAAASGLEGDATASALTTIARCRGLLMDGARLLPNIVFYLRQKERLRAFEKAVSGPLQAQDRALLLELIARCWYSPDQ